MNDVMFGDETGMKPGHSAYMSLSNSDKGELVFREIQHSYTFWSIKKAIKDEIIKS